MFWSFCERKIESTWIGLVPTLCNLNSIPGKLFCKDNAVSFSLVILPWHVKTRFFKFVFYCYKRLENICSKCILEYCRDQGRIKHSSKFDCNDTQLIFVKTATTRGGVLLSRLCPFFAERTHFWPNLIFPHSPTTPASGYKCTWSGSPNHLLPGVRWGTVCYRVSTV